MGDIVQFEQLVRSCLYNWLGYGKVNTRVWYIGMEEGGAEIWRQATLTLEESLELRSTYRLSMDFREVWEDKYGIPLDSFRGITVWHYMAAFLLSLRGMRPDSFRIREFLFTTKELGSHSSDHFLCELLPLPRRSNNSIEGYEAIWKSVDAYKMEVLPKRFDLITSVLQANTDVKLLISYDKTFTNLALGHFSAEPIREWKNSREKPYRLYSIHLDNRNSVLLLSTPFFGQGQCSYDGLAHAARQASTLLY